MNRLNCGFAQAEITPDPAMGIYIDGYGSRMAPAEGIRDPLYVKVCAIQSGEETFVIAVFDICGFHETLKNRLRIAIREYTGLADRQIAVCATHTHAGPACGILKHFPINWIYWNNVCILAAETVKKALSSTCACQLRFGYGKELTLPFNRRGKEIIDRRVLVCGFYDEKNRLKGVISSASCHPVCITDMKLSADYPAIMTARASSEYPGVPFLFLQGRGADIDPNFPNRDRVAMQPRLGKEFSDSVFEALNTLEKNGVSQGELSSLYRTIHVPLQYLKKEQMEAEAIQRKRNVDAAQAGIEAAQNATKQGNANPDLPKLQLAKTEALVEYFWMKENMEKQADGIPVSVKADLQIVIGKGGFAFVFAPFELLTPTGNQLEAIMVRHGIDPMHCFVIGYSNGTNGYLIPSSECSEDNYEVNVAAYWYNLPGVYCPDSEKEVLAAYEEMANILTRNRKEPMK